MVKNFPYSYVSMDHLDIFKLINHFIYLRFILAKNFIFIAFLFSSIFQDGFKFYISLILTLLYDNFKV